MIYLSCYEIWHSLAKCIGPGAVLLAPRPRAPEVRGEGAGFGPKITGRGSK